MSDQNKQNNQAVASGDAKDIWNSLTTASIAMQQRPPRRIARMVSLAVMAMALLALVYAYLARMDVVVSSQGSVITPGRSKVVQPLEAGVIKSIKVRDGQSVKAGDVLVELDPTSSLADVERLQRDWAEATADVERLEALATGKSQMADDLAIPAEVRANQQALLVNRQLELQTRLSALEADVVRRQADREAIATNLSQLQRSLELVRKRHEMRRELAQTGHIAEIALIDTQLELGNQEREVAVQAQRLSESSAALNAAQQQKALALAEFRSRVTTELVEATKKREGLQKELVKAQQRSELQVLKAPIDGVVQQLAVFTVGGVVTQAQVLMTIVPPSEGLEVEAKVINRDIGQVHVGQRVINKIETFDFTRYGYIEGEVQWVGTDAVVDQRIGAYYPVRIKLASTQTPNVVHGQKGQVTAGMSVTSDIRIGERRMLEYFLAPLMRYKEESLRER